MPSILGDTDENVSEYSKLDLRYVNQSGDKLQGSLNMEFNKIYNLPTPVNPGDAANRDYVDITRRNILLSVEASQPKFYGFHLCKVITATDYHSQILVTLPSGTHPSKVSLLLTSPELTIILNKTKTKYGAGILTEVLYHVVFKYPTVSSNYSLSVEGFVVVFPTEMPEITGKKIQFALESGSLQIRLENEISEESNETLFSGEESEH